MSNETQPIQAPKPKAKSRRERGKPIFTPLHKRAPSTTEVVKPPEVVDPSLGENDVRAQVIVKLTTRYGVAFANDDSEVLGAALDPANRGHIAKVMETSFSKMCAFVVHGFGRLMEEKLKVLEARQKESAKAEPKTARTIATRLSSGGTAGEPEEEGKPPLPTRPGAGFVPPLAPPPTRN